MKILMDSVFKELKKIIKSIQVKYLRDAKENDNIDILRHYEEYYLVSTKQDTFRSYNKFSKEAIRNSGMMDEYVIEDWYADKWNIPLEKREGVMAEQRKIILRDFEEKNEYYRCLLGLPKLKGVYDMMPSDDICEKYNIPKKPFKDLSRSDIIVLENDGYIDKFIKENPDYKFLKYRGKIKLDPIEIRESRNFGLLYIDKSIPSNLYKQFVDIYDQCREYFATAIYVPQFSTKYEYYDNFIGLCILTMAIQRCMVLIFKNGIERDFYDLDSIKIMFDSYKVPFIKELPMEYQRILLRNINKLLKYKSTDKVLFDICDIMGMYNVDIYKYLLVKERLYDDNGDPIFKFKTIQDISGKEIQVLDNEKMYDIYFQKVNIKERNTSLAINNGAAYREKYKDVIMDDAYWWDDDDLRESIYENEFNFIETKYINLTLMYKVTKIMFEEVYFLKMIQDKNSETSKILIELPKLIYSRPVSIFDSVILLFALLCKKYKFKGEIISDEVQVSTVLGFNFKQDIEKIRKLLIDNKRIVDPSVIDLLNNLSLTTINDVDLLYRNIRDFDYLLKQKMVQAKSIEEYRIYKTVFDSLMISDLTTDVFIKTDGTIATTYYDYLCDKDREYKIFLDNVEEHRIFEFMDHIIYKLEEVCSEITHLALINEGESAVTKALIELIRFFKSYTVDLKSMNIIYVMDDPYFNALRLIGKINHIKKDIMVTQDLNIDCKPILDKLIGVKDIQEIYQKGHLISNILEEQYIETKDEVKLKSNIVAPSYISPLIETIDIATMAYIDFLLPVIDKWKYKVNINIDDFKTFKNQIKTDAKIHTMENISFTYNEIIAFIKKMYKDEDIPLNDEFIYTVQNYLSDKLSLRQEYLVTSNHLISSDIEGLDSMDLQSKSYEEDNMIINDKNLIINKLKNTENIDLIHQVKSMSKDMDREDYMDLTEDIILNSNYDVKNSIKVKDDVSITTLLTGNQDLNVVEVMKSINSELNVKEVVVKSDDIDVNANYEVSEDLKLDSNKCDINSNQKINSGINLSSSIKLIYDL